MCRHCGARERGVGRATVSKRDDDEGNRPSREEVPEVVFEKGHTKDAVCQEREG